MKTIAQLEQLERLYHETGLTGQALQDKWTLTYTSTGRETPLCDYHGGPIAEKYVPKR